MRNWIVAIFLATASLGACATTATITQAPLTEGTAREFEGDFAAVREATRLAIQQDLPVTMAGVEQHGASHVFHFEISVSAFSWGEVGRVVVTPVDADTTRVIVRAEKRFPDADHRARRGKPSRAPIRQFGPPPALGSGA